MPFAFRCPVCAQRLSGEDHQIGAHWRCPRCDCLLEVPDPRTTANTRAGVWRGAELVAHEAPIRFRPSQRGAQSAMDMTPMVDVTFLLLIFFMVTAAFSLQKSFEIPAPQQEQASKQPIEQIEDSDYVIVRVDRYNTFHVEAATWDQQREAPSEQDLLVRLREARRGPLAATRMLVMASGEASHEKVVTAMDAGTAVGMEDIQLVTMEDEDSAWNGH